MGRMAELAAEMDERAWQDMADEQLSPREVRWVCVYCWHEVPYEGAPHCGEVHSEPMTNEEIHENE